MPSDQCSPTWFRIAERDFQRGGSAGRRSLDGGLRPGLFSSYTGKEDDPAYEI